MKRVLLLGDSIRMGYDEYVKEILKDEFEVVYDDYDNGRFAAYTLWQANQFFRNFGRFDVVHWNNGYWDMHVEAPMKTAIHPVDEYVYFLGRILNEIRNNGATPVFATTTPILSDETAAEVIVEGVAYSRYNNDWVTAYNAAAVAFMKREGVAVNDLYALCAKDPHCYKCPDLLHLTDEGYRRCAEQTAQAIREAAENRAG
ncbi:MAG: SGNH/GDSL hydrolase family protein [Clostridia bacterium]|nr:SGNH/GDSL hydrolase family protein [Clostridia bacterium]